MPLCYEGWDVNQRNYCVLVLGYSSRNMIVNLFIVVQMKFNPLLDRAARDEEGGGAALPSSRKKKLTKINY